MISSSFFMSGSSRLAKTGRELGRGPGPASYNPEPVGAKSFQLNLAGRWVG